MRDAYLLLSVWNLPNILGFIFFDVYEKFKDNFKGKPNIYYLVIAKCNKSTIILFTLFSFYIFVKLSINNTKL